MTETSPQYLVFPVPTGDTLVLFQELDFTDKLGTLWRIKRAEMARKDYCGDLKLFAVQVNPLTNKENPFGYAGDLAEDPCALDAVNKQLKAMGYSGPELGRAELGMQEDEYFVLESPPEFLQFAHERFGWEYEEGMGVWRLDQESRLFCQSFPANASATFDGTDGSRWEIGLDALSHAFTKAVAETFKDKDEGVAYLKETPVRGDAQALLDWAIAHAEEHWALLSNYVRQVARPQPEDQLQAFHTGARLKS